LPAGKVEVGLTLKENAIKEAKEETGFDVKIIREVGVYHKENDKAVKHAFEAKIVAGEIHIPEDEIMAVEWFTIEQIHRLNQKGFIRDDWVVKAIAKVEEEI